VATLGESLRQQRLDAERLNEPEFDRSARQLFVTELRSSDPSKITYVLGLLETARWDVPYPSIRKLLDHEVAEVRAKAILVLRNRGDLSVVPRVEQLLRDPNLSVRTEALLFLSHHQSGSPDRIQDWGLQDFSIRATVAFLARSKPDPASTCRLILENMIKTADPLEHGHASKARDSSAFLEIFVSYLSELLKGPAGREKRFELIGQQQFVPQLIALLGNPDVNVAVGTHHLGETFGQPSDHLSHPEWRWR
jgi:hypothetical protein